MNAAMTTALTIEWPGRKTPEELANDYAKSHVLPAGVIREMAEDLCQQIRNKAEHMLKDAAPARFFVGRAYKLGADSDVEVTPDGRVNVRVWGTGKPDEATLTKTLEKVIREDLTEKWMGDVADAHIAAYLGQDPAE